MCSYPSSTTFLDLLSVHHVTLPRKFLVATKHGSAQSISTDLVQEIFPDAYWRHFCKLVYGVRFGPHLNQEQLCKARELVKEFADVFALSIREVKPVDFIKFRLQIPEDATFSKKVHQRPLTKPQREYLFPVLDGMRRVGIIRFIPADEVKAVVSTVLVQKTHSGTSLSLDDIREIVNQQCIALAEPSDHTIDTKPTFVTSPEPVDPAWSFDQCTQHERGVDGVSKIQAHSVPKRTMLVHRKQPRRRVVTCVSTLYVFSTFHTVYHGCPFSQQLRKFLAFCTHSNYCGVMRHGLCDSCAYKDRQHASQEDTYLSAFANACRYAP
jgi:hypothetical protein